MTVFFEIDIENVMEEQLGVFANGTLGDVSSLPRRMRIGVCVYQWELEAYYHPTNSSNIHKLLNIPCIARNLANITDTIARYHLTWIRFEHL